MTSWKPMTFWKPSLLTLVLLVTAMMAAGCQQGGRNQLNPTPDFGVSEPITASQMWEIFQARPGTLAADRYKDRWAVIEIDRLSTVTADGKAIQRMPGTLQALEFRFNYPEDADEVNDGNDRVLCNIRGVNLTQTTLIFQYCRPWTG